MIATIVQFVIVTVCDVKHACLYLVCKYNSTLHFLILKAFHIPQIDGFCTLFVNRMRRRCSSLPVKEVIVLASSCLITMQIVISRTIWTVFLEMLHRKDCITTLPDYLTNIYLVFRAQTPPIVLSLQLLGAQWWLEPGPCTEEYAVEEAILTGSLYNRGSVRRSNSVAGTIN